MPKNKWILVIPDLFLDKNFEYKIPASLEGKISIGSLVFVPFGGKKIYAFVIKLLDNPTYDEKKIKNVLSVSPDFSISPHLIALAFWMSFYYCSPLATVFKLIIPSALRKHKYKQKKKTFYSFNKEKFDNDGLESLKRKPVLSKLVSILSTSLPQGKDKAELKNFLQCTDLSFRNLIRLSWLLPSEKKINRFLLEEKKFAQAKITLNKEQEKALKLITNQLENKEKNVLLYGVTGSGKTEVFLQAIEHCLKLGKQALVLVPEISLAYQTVDCLIAKFGNNLAILHSGLNQMEKTEQWLKVEKEKTPIIVGARSAVFAPIHNLGLIVVDEEHEAAYKQESSIRYNARDCRIIPRKRRKRTRPPLLRYPFF